MADTMRIGLIGCGNHARANLTPAIKTVEGVQLVACADADEVAAHGAVQDLGFERPYLDYQEMLSRETLDGVFVATPHHVLKDAVIAAVQSGRPVLVEKPMALSKAGGEEIREAARKAGVPVMVAFCVRYAEGRRTMKSLLERGVVGDVILVNAAKAGPEHPLTSWRSQPDKGGGQLLWLGSHITDQLLWLIGDEPERVYGEIYWHRDTGADQNTAYTIRFKSGVIANVLCSQNVTTGVDFVEIIGSAGRIKADWPSNVVEVQSEVLPEYKHPTTIRPRTLSNPQMYQDEMRAWLESVAQRREPPITVDDGVNVLAIIDAVFESGRTGVPVTLA